MTTIVFHSIASGTFGTDGVGVIRQGRLFRQKWNGQILKRTLLLSVTALVVGSSPDARASNVAYMVALSPDGSRVAVGKTEKRPRWDLHEGSLKQPLRKVPLPTGTHGTGIFQYSPDGRDLLFATAPSRPGPATSGSDKGTAFAAAQSPATETLWRRQVASGDTTSPTKIFEHDGFTNVLPLLDGSIAFMGSVRQVKKPYSPLQPGNNTWSTYSWMVRKADGSVTVVNPRRYAFFSHASLIRDEAVFFVEQRYVNGQPVRPHEFQINVTALKPGADLSDLAPLGTIRSDAQPQLQCDWFGKTCIRTTVYIKNKYYAHQLEIIREGKPCKVAGLPDRLERITISRDGKAVALVTRPNPYENVDYKLAHLTIGDKGCASDIAFIELP